jgi:phosphoglycolate phosphatase
MTYSHILFDLDGTLMDPKVGITRSVAYALRRFNIVIEEEALDALTPFIGPPLRDSFAHFYGFSTADAEKAVEVYREYYAKTGLFENTLYPGIESILESLVRQGTRLYVATSKPTLFAEQILDYLGLRQYFSRVVGSNMDHTRVNKSEVIEWLLKEAHIPAASALMVGDRRYDVEGARACGVDCVAAGFGYGSSEELEAAQPAYHVETVDALKDLLLRLTRKE